jgi:hypothetical protein
MSGYRPLLVNIAPAAAGPIHLQKATISDHGRNKIDNGCKALERWALRVERNSYAKKDPEGRLRRLGYSIAWTM